jgi:hypothetical protein
MLGLVQLSRVLSGLGLAREIAPPEPRRLAVSSPWAEGALEQIAWADIFGSTDPDIFPVTRAEAMRVPAFAKARWLICTVLGRHPLRDYIRDEVTGTQPAWLSRTNGVTSPQLRMVWTLDDLMWSGYSLWGVLRGADGQIIQADRVPRDWWALDPDGRVLVKDQPVSAEQVILFSSVMDPILDIGKGTIRAALNLERAWAARVKDPIPVVELRQTEEVELVEDEPEEGDDGETVDATLSEGYSVARDYLRQRRTGQGAVLVTPYGWETHIHGERAVNVLVEARNAVAVDVGRFTGLPSSLLDASPVQSSLTYTTRETERSTFDDYSVAGWAMAIEARLSMDDCTPAGHSIKFDLSWLSQSGTPATGPTVED